MTFRRILIANRGEIAIRIARACREAGIASVAIYSDADRNAPHVRAADRAVHVGPAPSSQSYLSIPTVIDDLYHERSFCNPIFVTVSRILSQPFCRGDVYTWMGATFVSVAGLIFSRRFATAS